MAKPARVSWRSRNGVMPTKQPGGAAAMVSGGGIVLFRRTHPAYGGEFRQQAAFVREIEDVGRVWRSPPVSWRSRKGLIPSKQPGDAAAVVLGGGIALFRRTHPAYEWRISSAGRVCA